MTARQLSGRTILRGSLYMRVPEMTSYEIITRIDGPTNSHAYTKIQCPVTSMILMQASTSKKDCYC